jgi:hypothetical protein
VTQKISATRSLTGGAARLLVTDNGIACAIGRFFQLALVFGK